MWNLKNAVLFTLFAVNLVDQPAPEVTVEQGTISGKINALGTVHEYTGIPYATVKEWFQAPVPAPPWKGIYRAVDEHYQCHQALGLASVGTEYCLKINVYVPAFPSKKRLPVMFQIHGGAFMMGSGKKLLLGPDFLVKHDVILVTFNYRLGALGFLCLGIKEAPGNAGLKDQIAALRWVKKNIAAFGGDPDNITIFGHSAGGTSTALLVMSEATNGLFNRAIVQSGSALAHWASEDGLTIASAHAKFLGHNTKDPYELYNFFKNIPVEELVAATRSQTFLQLSVNKLIIGPCIEKEFPGIEPVFTEMPYDVIKRNPKNISVIYGITDREGLFLAAKENNDSLKKMNEIYDFPDFEFPSKDIAESVARMVKEFYFGYKDPSEETMDNMIRLIGDTYFDVPLILETKLMVNNISVPIYNYYFKYAGGRNIVKYAYAKNRNEPGASHGDDAMYIFSANIYPFKINESDQKVIDWMTKMWTNFAKYGDPTPASDTGLPIKWEPSTKEKLNFLYIDKTLETGPYPNPDRFTLWKNLYEKYRKRK